MIAAPAKLTVTQGRGPFFFEKWYLDTIVADGTLLIIVLGQVRILGLRLARFAAELYRPDGSSIHEPLALGKICRLGEARLFDGGRLTPTQLAWNGPNLSGDLRLTPRHSPSQIRDPLLRHGRRQLRWLVELPDADVEGRLTWPGGGLDLRGRGYRDYLALDILPWRLPIREMVWGRACAADHASWWFQLTTREETVSGTWRDGHLTADVSIPRLFDQRVFEDQQLGDTSPLRIGLARGVLRRLAGDSHRTRWLARAELEGALGWAVHEQLRWR